MSATLADLQVTLPYYHRLSDRIATDFSGSVILFAGRDAEVLHDDFAITHPDLNAHLLPASTCLWYSDGMLDENLAAQFLEAHDLGGAAITKSKEAYVLVDSGFRGTIGEKLNSKILSLHGVSLLEAGRMAIRLVCREGGAFSEQLMTFTDKDFRDFQLQRDPAVGSNLHLKLASSMQVMPRFHGAYTDLAEKNGQVVAVPCTEAEADVFTGNVDKNITWVNESVVNPVAAAVTQYRVVLAALERFGASTPLRTPLQSESADSSRRLWLPRFLSTHKK